MDEFLASHGERLVFSPVKHALLQRDLWAVFDGVADHQWFIEPPRRQALQRKLVQVMKRLALTRAQIDQLPDNYAEAVAAQVFPTEPEQRPGGMGYLPPNLFQPNGPWVSLGGNGTLPLARIHVNSNGKSAVFRPFLRLPAGREATLAYLDKLREFNRQYSTGKTRWDPPEFPTGTRLAIVRQVIVIDTEGTLAPTHLTDLVELRVVRGTKTNLVPQDGYEFTLNRPNLFDGQAGGFRPSATNEFRTVQFSRLDPYSHSENDHPIETLRQPQAMQFCRQCHAGPGINSMLSYTRAFMDSGQRISRPNDLVETGPAGEADKIISSKQEQPEWQVLQKLWRLASQTDK